MTFEQEVNVPSVNVLPLLSPREMEVTELVAEALTNKSIAALLGVNEERVVAICGSVYSKFALEEEPHLNKRVWLAQWALRNRFK